MLTHKELIICLQLVEARYGYLAGQPLTNDTLDESTRLFSLRFTLKKELVDRTERF